MINPKNRFYFEDEDNHKIIIVKDEWVNHKLMAEKMTLQPLADLWKNRIGN